MWYGPLAWREGKRCGFRSTGAGRASSVVAAVEPLRRYEEGRRRDGWPLRCDDDREVRSRVPVVALADLAGDVLPVTLAGDAAVEPVETAAVQDTMALMLR